MEELNDGVDPYADIPLAISWFRYVFWDDLVSQMLVQKFYATPAEVLKLCHKTINKPLPNIPEIDQELHAKVLTQVNNPLFDRYVEGLMGSA
jgi:hypothetical protein